MNWMDAFRAFVAHRTGVAIDADKQYLIETRLAPLVRAFNFERTEDLALRAMAGVNPEITTRTLEAMMTGETLFFRDKAPFELFRERMLPQLLDQRSARRQIRILCAASSSGQEPYSLAMILDEHAHALRGWRVDLIATDISEAAIERARQGYYNRFEVQRGLPVTQLLRYFHREGERWRIAEHLRMRVDFRQLNILHDVARLGAFDVIFCRNVLIYFDLATRRKALANVSSALAPGGWLVLGATETSLGDLADNLAPVRDMPSVFARGPRIVLATRTAGA